MRSEIFPLLHLRFQSGDVDLMIEIVARDMQHYSQVVLRDVFNTKGVNATRSSFVLEEIKSIY